MRSSSQLARKTPYVLPERAEIDPAAIEAADYAMRNWQGPAGKIRYGSDAHRDLFSRMFLESHNPYKPAIIEWPRLNDEERNRLIGLPIWDLAVQTEGHAGIRVSGYGETVADPQLREAVLMNGAEEQRHKQVLHHMVNAYGVKLQQEPDYPPPHDREWGFMITGFSECIDSFFAFGLFALAKHSGFFPPALVDTFEPVMQEECRHILFFTNWLVWHRRNLHWTHMPAYWLKCWGIFASIVRDRLKTAGDVGSGDNFTATGHEAMGIDARLSDLLSLCLVENDRRFAGYDQRLLRPNFVPRMARLFLPFIKLFGQ